MNQFILRAAQLLDGTGAPAAGPAAVVVNRGKIEHVALGRQMDDLPDGIPVIDAGDRTVLPGLIDAHVHLCFNAAADHAAVRAEIEGQTDVRIALRAAANAAIALAAGITTVRDCGGTGTVIQQLRDAIATGILPGPHILACGSPITTTAGHLYFCGMSADNLDEVRKAVRQIVRQQADWVKIMASGGNMTAGSNPWMPQYSAAEIQAAVDEAHRLRKRIAAHILCAESVRHCVAAGVDTLEHCLWYNQDGKLDWDDRVADRIIKEQIPIVYTAAGIARLNLPDGESPEAEQAAALRRLREDLATTRRFREAGANLVIASDAGVRMTPLDSFHLSLRVAVEGIGMSIEEAIHSVTGRAAAAIGLEAETGTITPGKRADLVVIDGHLDDSFSALANPVLVVKAGNVMQPGWKLLRQAVGEKILVEG